MRVQGGLQPEDWRRWGEFTTFKSNAAALLNRSLRPEQIIYCSPLVDPYQPAEESEQLMPRILNALISKPPKVFAIQTRGSLILRDLDLLAKLSARTSLRVSFSLTTNRDGVRRLYEPHCSPVSERISVMRRLRAAGVCVYATLAPLLPCDPEELAETAIESTDRDVLGDPLHVRSTKPRGATTRRQAERVSAVNGFGAWHDPRHQLEVVERIRKTVEGAGRRFAIGPEAFRWLAEREPQANV